VRRELPGFETTNEAINCHHNYVQQEKHFGERVFVTRKGNPESFCSCAHGAGRRMSRSEAKRRLPRHAVRRPEARARRAPQV
jgi:tRNA-splicing ligase RtcB